VALFVRLPHAVVLTEEGQSLLPALTAALDRIAHGLERFESRSPRDVLRLGIVGTFAVRWLMPRLHRFQEGAPGVEVRVFTHNNKVDLAGEGLDMAIRFGAGDWHGAEATEILSAPLSPLCTPRLGARLRSAQDLASVTLLRSYRREEWPNWFAAAGVEPPRINGPVFDSLTLMVHAAVDGHGVALAPTRLFDRELRLRQLVQVLPLELDAGRYWLTWPASKRLSESMTAFRDWCLSPAFQNSADVSR
jgi:LysR family transcriptional regulator of beta-lactamase